MRDRPVSLSWSVLIQFAFPAALTGLGEPFGGQAIVWVSGRQIVRKSYPTVSFNDDFGHSEPEPKLW